MSDINETSELASAAPRDGLSYVVGDKTANLRHITIPQMFAETVARHGDSDALVLPKEGITLGRRLINTK